KIIAGVLKEEFQPEAMADHLDAKTRLQELLQRDGSMPVYEYLSVEGPPHAPVFCYRVLDGERVLGEGSGSSKQNAQQAAARDALKRMGALS
ncbi:MAG: putative dsRNA-binding protein, partial [Christensenellales bacterium]|nr:putative dsRNA-binding protein [Christensenellales bacterium]